MVRGAIWRQVRQANPSLNDQEVDALLERAADQERALVLKHGLNLDQAREIANRELLPSQGPDRT